MNKNYTFMKIANIPDRKAKKMLNADDVTDMALLPSMLVPTEEHNYRIKIYFSMSNLKLYAHD